MREQDNLHSHGFKTVLLRKQNPNPKINAEVTILNWKNNTIAIYMTFQEFLLRKQNPNPKIDAKKTIINWENNIISVHAVFQQFHCVNKTLDPKSTQKKQANLGSNSSVV